LRAAGIGLRPPGAWGKTVPPKPANGVTTDSGAERIFPARTPMFCLPRSGRRRVRHCERLSSPCGRSGCRFKFEASQNHWQRSWATPPLRPEVALKASDITPVETEATEEPAAEKAPVVGKNLLNRAREVRLRSARRRSHCRRTNENRWLAGDLRRLSVLMRARGFERPELIYREAIVRFGWRPGSQSSTVKLSCSCQDYYFSRRPTSQEKFHLIDSDSSLGPVRPREGASGVPSSPAGF